MNSKKITAVLMICYLVMLTWAVIFKFSFSPADMPHMRNINLIPFASSAIANGTIDYSEIILNLIAFIPFGMFIHVIWKERSFLQQILPIICTSLVFEIVQYLFAIGASDITDLITNSLGGLLGITLALGVSKITNKHWVAIINIVSLIAALLLGFLIILLIIANI